MTKDAFEEAFEARFLGAELEPCDCCGGPSRNAMPVLIVWGGGEPRRCGLCSGLVHDDGRTAVGLTPDGTTRCKVIIIYGEETDAPQVPDPPPARMQELCLEDGDS